MHTSFTSCSTVVHVFAKRPLLTLLVIAAVGVAERPAQKNMFARFFPRGNHEHSRMAAVQVQVSPDVTARPGE